VHAELPGLNKTDVSLNIQDGVLEIKGSKNIEKKSEGRTFRKTERTYGSFVRRLPIDKSVKPEEVKAKFENGVLEVTVPKKQHAEKEGAIPIE
jgi:HSP20 family protein